MSLNKNDSYSDWFRTDQGDEFCINYQQGVVTIDCESGENRVELTEAELNWMLELLQLVYK